MKKISEILQNIDFQLINGSLETKIEKICINSNDCTKNSLFIAIVGTKADGHNFVNSAIKKGATAVLISKKIDIPQNTTAIYVEDTQKALAIAAANFYDNPANDLKIIGVTGTNGKTTTATVLFELFKNLGFSCGLISTIEIKINNQIFPTKLTTPDALTLHQWFKKMIDNGMEYVFMEVSSHSLVQKRVFGIPFKVAIFTNITHDHLDFHKDFKNYLNAKKILFDSLSKDSFALVNNDDKHSSYIVQNTKAKVYTYALKNMADFKAKIIEKHFDGTLVFIDNQEVWIKFVGEFNVYNILAVYATAVLLNMDKTEVLRILSTINPVKGRFDTVKGKGIFGIIDYAHTPDALEKILKELKSIKQKDQRIITVVGAGGDRDKAKRPKMAAVSQFYSDIVILTSDNPRTEDPEKILDDMEQGLDKSQDNFLRITDRKNAIKTAVNLAKKSDIILIAGKGHETYQEINGIRYDFDDKKILSEFLKN